MKIFFDFQDMSGGAPRSQLAHMRVMKEAGHDVVATIGEDIEDLSLKAGAIKVIEVKNFSVRRPLKSIFNIIDWVYILRHECPDVIQSNRANQFKFLAVVSDMLDIPLVFVQSGGEVKPYHVKPMKGKISIVYSWENKMSFLKAGFKNGDVYLIPNRIPFKNIHTGNYDNDDPGLNVLIIGNIKRETIKGLTALLDLVKNNADKFHMPFIMRIVGEDISERKVYQGRIKEVVQHVNETLEGCCRIEYLGWMDDVEKLQESSDICVGKGRSVIQPAMYGKVCFVLSETGVLTRVNTISFDLLFKYNFSGRGNQPDDTQQFIHLLRNGCNQDQKQEARNVSSKIREFYLQDFAQSKLERVYRRAIDLNTKQNKKIRVKKSFSRLISIYFNLFKSLTALHANKAFRIWPPMRR